MTVHQSLAGWSSWVWPFLANHLWQSTLLSIAAFASAALLKNAPGRARYAIWLIASAKFVIPSALLVYIAGYFGFRFPALLASVPESAQGYVVIYQPTSPLNQLDETAAGRVAAAHGHNELFCVFTVIWLTGCIFLLALWWRRRQRFRRTVVGRSIMNITRERRAFERVRSWIGIRRDVDLLVVPGAIEPGVWGVWRPVVLLPENIAEDLSEAELEAVMMHEMIHVARWDNLIANLHRTLCCLLWFHPIVWILDRLLLADREKACDEEVIRLGGASDAYASSLLKVIRFCLGWSVAGASNATGSNLGRRVEQIMSGNVHVKFSMWHRAAVGSIAAVAIAMSLAVGFLARSGVVAQTIKSQKGIFSARTTDIAVENASVEVRMPSAEDSIATGTIVKWLKEVGDSVMPGEPLFEVSAGNHTEVVPSAVSGILAQVKVKEGQSVPVNAVVAIIQLRSLDVGRDTREAGGYSSYGVTNGQERLIERLQAAPLTAIDFKNSAKSPLVINDASVKAVPRVLSEPGDEYAVVPVIAMVNNSDRRIKGFALEFRNGLDRRAYYERMPAPVDRGAVYTSGQQNRFIILMGGTNGWTVRVVGVLFEDDDVWGAVPPPPPPAPPPPPPVPKELMRLLEQAPEVQIQFEGVPGAPLSITSASGRTVKINGVEPDGAPLYFMLPNIQVMNNARKKIAGFGLEFADRDSQQRTYVERARVSIEPSGVFSFRGFGGDGAFTAVGLGFSPDRVLVRVVGVKFEDGEVWGTFIATPPAPPPPPEAPSTGPTRIPGAEDLIRKSGGVMTNSATHRVDAEYPPLARAARISGSVVVEVTIDETGSVISARAVSGHPLLNDAAVSAARQWQFAPTMLAGVPTKVIGTLTFTFAP